MNINVIKTLLSTDKVCFVTNSFAMPSSLLVPSLKTYLEYIPIQNLWIIPGIKDNKPFYGLSAFVHMLQYMLSNNYFDYVIYIDEDCFITDFEALINEFNKFKNSECCLAGPQDGGVFCHRNHSKLLINTFLSFWNIKLLRDKNISFEDIINYLSSKTHTTDIFSNFFTDLKTKPELFNIMNMYATSMHNNSKKFRIKHVDLPANETPYCKTVRNDVNNPIEPNQVPYSFDDSTAIQNFEPYYVIEQALIMLTNKPIYYLFGTDLYDSKLVNTEKYDMSGLTSVIYSTDTINTNEDRKLIAVHTWFSRAYTKWPNTQVQLDHTKRINTIIKKFSRI